MGVDYRMRVTSSHKTTMDRQGKERVDISSFQGPVLMNRRTEMVGGEEMEGGENAAQEMGR